MAGFPIRFRMQFQKHLIALKTWHLQTENEGLHEDMWVWYKIA